MNDPRYNTIQWGRAHLACSLPSCTVARHSGSFFCSHHWQRGLVMAIACYNHNVGCLLKRDDDIAAMRQAREIALYATDIDVAGFVLSNLTKDIQEYLYVSQRDVAAILSMAHKEVAA